MKDKHQWLKNFIESGWQDVLGPKLHLFIRTIHYKYNQEDGYVYGSDKTLMRETGFSKSVFYRVKKASKELGLIKDHFTHYQGHQRKTIALSNEQPNPDPEILERFIKTNPKLVKYLKKLPTTRVKQEKSPNKAPEGCLEKRQESPLIRDKGGALLRDIKVFKKEKEKELNKLHLVTTPKGVDDQSKAELFFLHALREAVNKKLNIDIEYEDAKQLIKYHHLEYLLEKLDDPRIAKDDNPIDSLINIAAADYNPEINKEEMEDLAFQCRVESHYDRCPYCMSSAPEKPPHNYCLHCPWYYTKIALEHSD